VDAPGRRAAPAGTVGSTGHSIISIIIIIQQQQQEQQQQQSSRTLEQ
jgi:hypothetical protein